MKNSQDWTLEVEEEAIDMRKQLRSKAGPDDEFLRIGDTF